MSKHLTAIRCLWSRVYLTVYYEDNIEYHRMRCMSCRDTFHFSSPYSKSGESILLIWLIMCWLITINIVHPAHYDTRSIVSIVADASLSDLQMPKDMQK